MQGTRHLALRDVLATLFVALGVLVYVLWLAGVGSGGSSEVKVVAGIFLALGFAASASAVVPGFEGLWHGSIPYLVVTSLLGLGAFVAGVVALATGEEVALGVLVAVTIAMWAIATIRHTASAGAGAGGGRSARAHPASG
jgi:hypothetical protein